MAINNNKVLGMLLVLLTFFMMSNVAYPFTIIDEVAPLLAEKKPESIAKPVEVKKEETIVVKDPQPATKTTTNKKTTTKKKTTKKTSTTKVTKTTKQTKQANTKIATVVKKVEAKSTFKVTPEQETTKQETTVKEIKKEIKPSNIKEYLPSGVERLTDIVYKESQEIIPEIYPWYFYSLIEQESCITLTHSKCWNEKSELKNSREQGTGIFQLTRAWDAKGKLRFDTLTDLSKKYGLLKDLNWNNVKTRPDLQIRAGLLLSKENFFKLYTVTDINERIAMTDAAYNGGIGHTLKERVACGILKGCDPQKWFGHVENIKTVKSQKKIKAYGNKSAYEINREHTRNVMTVRLLKYKNYVINKYGSNKYSD